MVQRPGPEGWLHVGEEGLVLSFHPRLRSHVVRLQDPYCFFGKGGVLFWKQKKQWRIMTVGLVITRVIVGSWI